MDKLFFKTERNGFCGTYYEDPRGADCAIIGLFGDDPNDYMAKCGARWLLAHGNIKVGIMGMSTAGMEALVAAMCTAAGSSPRPAPPRLLIVESRFRTCRLPTSTQRIGRRSMGRPRAPETFSAPLQAASCNRK